MRVQPAEQRGYSADIPPGSTSVSLLRSTKYTHLPKRVCVWVVCDVLARNLKLLRWARIDVPLQERADGAINPFVPIPPTLNNST